MAAEHPPVSIELASDPDHVATRCAAACAMRRAPQDGQASRRLQLKATSLSCPLSLQRSLGKSCAAMPHSTSASNSSLPNGGFGVGEELSRRAAKPCETAWSARGGDACTGSGRYRTPGGAAHLMVSKARWVACSDDTDTETWAPQPDGREYPLMAVENLSPEAAARRMKCARVARISRVDRMPSSDTCTAWPYHT